MMPVQQHRIVLFLALSATYLSGAWAQGVDPTVIQTCEAETTQITVQVPPSANAEPVDVMFLFDDTGARGFVVDQIIRFCALLHVQ